MWFGSHTKRFVAPSTRVVLMRGGSPFESICKDRSGVSAAEFG